MDDKLYEAWSEELVKLREGRLKSFQQMHRQKGSDFEPRDFVDLAMTSLDDILKKWWSFETQSLKVDPNQPPAKLLDSLTAEMDSIFDFEWDSIERDLTDLLGKISWKSEEVEREMAQFKSFSKELRRSLLSQIRETIGVSAAAGPAENVGVLEPHMLVPEPVLVPVPPSPPLVPPVPIVHPPSVPQHRGGRPSSGGGGVALFLMFLLGLLLGSGPSLYFWDREKKSDSGHEEKLASLSAERRLLEEDNAIYRQHMADLATGKLETLRELEDQIRPIRTEMANRKAKIENDFISKRESLMKKTPPGDRLDRSLERLKEMRDESLSAIEAEEQTRLDPLRKKYKILKDLIGQ